MSLWFSELFKCLLVSSEVLTNKNVALAYLAHPADEVGNETRDLMMGSGLKGPA